MKRGNSRVTHRPDRRASVRPGPAEERYQEVSVKKYVAPGSIWKGESVMETNWNKICEDPRPDLVQRQRSLGHRPNRPTAIIGPGGSATPRRLLRSQVR
jgi:hypothetical protein